MLVGVSEKGKTEYLGIYRGCSDGKAYIENLYSGSVASIDPSSGIRVRFIKSANWCIRDMHSEITVLIQSIFDSIDVNMGNIIWADYRYVSYRVVITPGSVKLYVGHRSAGDDYFVVFRFFSDCVQILKSNKSIISSKVRNIGDYYFSYIDGFIKKELNSITNVMLAYGVKELLLKKGHQKLFAGRGAYDVATVSGVGYVLWENGNLFTRKVRLDRVDLALSERNLVDEYPAIDFCLACFESYILHEKCKLGVDLPFQGSRGDLEVFRDRWYLREDCSGLYRVALGSKGSARLEEISRVHVEALEGRISYWELRYGSRVLAASKNDKDYMGYLGSSEILCTFRRELCRGIKNSKIYEVKDRGTALEIVFSYRGIWYTIVYDMLRGLCDKPDIWSNDDCLVQVRRVFKFFNVKEDIIS